MAQGGTGLKKPTMNILQECVGKQNELMIRFVLETRFEELKSKLKNSDINLYKLDGYIAKPLQGVDNWKAEVFQIIEEFTINCKVISLPAKEYVHDRLKDYSVRIIKVGDKLEVCGDKHTIDNIVMESDNSWKHMELVEVPLTNKERAILYLYDLWECSFFKQNEIRVEKKSLYNATVKFYTDENVMMQNEIKDEIARKRVFVTTEKLNDKVFDLIKHPDAQAKIDKKLNFYPIRATKCAWYADEQTSTVSFYGKSQQQADDSHKEFMSFINQVSVQIPSRFTSAGQVINVVDGMNTKFSGSAIVCLNPKLNRIDYVCTDDVKWSIKTEMEKSFFFTRTVRTSDHKDFCKSNFESFKALLESKWLVEVKAEGEYRWEIKGLPGDVDKAYSELNNIVMGICSKDKTFILDGKIQRVQGIVEKCCKEMSCLAEVKETTSTYDGINLQEDVLCHEWVTPSLNTLRLINSDQASWLTSKSKAVKMETSDESNKEFNEDMSSATIFLPKWNNGKNKEKTKLSCILTNFFTLSSCARATKHPLVFEMRATADWPWEKSLKILLPTLDSQQGVSPVYICEADRRKFEDGSRIIQTFLQQQSLLTGIDIKVISGELAKQKTDVVVNSTATDLNLTQGAVSSTILKSAGKEIQNECKQIMTHRKYKPLDANEVVVTSAYNMSSCKLVFHGALAIWNRQRLPEFVQNCLHQADNLELGTIAFPSLGTGNLNYPPDEVARIMFETIRMYGLQRKITNLKEVMLVIYPKDVISLMAFQKVEGVFKAGCPKKESRVKCPNTLKIKVSLTGKDQDTVVKAFGALENMLRQAEYLSEPPTQLIDRDEKTNRAKEPPEDDDESSIEWTAWGVQETTERKEDSSLNSDVGQLKQVESDGTESVNFIKFGIKDGNEQTYTTLVGTLKKYYINNKSLVWSPLYPQEARIKLNDDNDRIKACTMLEKEAKYERQQYEADAVINIRAQLSDKACQYLRENTGQITNLERQSGVDVLPECKVITGDLYSLSIAREILSQMISKQPRDSRFHYLNKTQGNDFNDDNVKKMTNEETTVTSLDHTIGRHTEDLSRNRGARPKEHVTLVFNESSLIKSRTPPTGGLERGEDVGSQREATQKERITTSSQESSLGKKSNSPTGGIEQDADDGEDEDEDEKKDEYVCIGDVSGQGNGSAYHPPPFPNLDDTFMIPTKENISVHIYQGNLCYLDAKGIVNSTNESMNPKFGLCKVVMQNAGPLVQKNCQEYICSNGKLQQGSVFSTQAGKLDHYDNIIHVCAPIWEERESKEMFEKNLFNIVYVALVTADDLKLESVAFPAIGSGGRGAPKQVCFVTFARAVRSYSLKNSKSSMIKQIHFVDQQSEVVDSLKTAFVHVLLEDDAQRESMFTKISSKIRKTYDFPTLTLGEKATVNGYNVQTLPNNVKLVLCDGPLLSAPTHKHICDTTFADSCLVIPICEDMKREGCAMALCRQRSTDEFERFLDNLQKKKRKAGDVIGMVHDKNIKFAHIVSPVMPKIDKKAQKIDTKFRKSFATSCEKVLITFDKKGVNHIVFPVLTLDMYPNEAESFTAENIKTMFNVMYTFSFGRKNKRRLTIHIPTDSAVYKLCHAVLQNCKWITETATETKV